jgi:DNA-binding response OmpR family regulator
MALETRRAERASTGPQRARSDCRVLVIDDNADAADTVGMFLETEGFPVVVGYCGQDAFRAVGAGPIDIAILDIGLPDVNGYEIAAAMRGLGDTPLLIAVTGWGARSDVERAFQAGFDFHFTKPAPLTELLALIDERCRGEKHRYDPKRGTDMWYEQPRGAA